MATLLRHPGPRGKNNTGTPYTVDEEALPEPSSEVVTTNVLKLPVACLFGRGFGCPFDHGPEFGVAAELDYEVVPVGRRVRRRCLSSSSVIQTWYWSGFEIASKHIPIFTNKVVFEPHTRRDRSGIWGEPGVHF